MCGCTSNFFPQNANLPYSEQNTQIGLMGLPFNQYTWSNLTASEIEQRCKQTYSTPAEIQRCIEANQGEASGGGSGGNNFWQNAWSILGGLFQNNANNPPSNYPPPAPPADEKKFPWGAVAIVGGILLVGGIAWYAVSKSK